MTLLAPWLHDLLTYGLLACIAYVAWLAIGDYDR